MYIVFTMTLVCGIVSLKEKFENVSSVCLTQCS